MGYTQVGEELQQHNHMNVNFISDVSEISFISIKSCKTKCVTPLLALDNEDKDCNDVYTERKSEDKRANGI